jgi:hypothetical protein
MTSSRMRRTQHVGKIGWITNASHIFFGKPDGKGTFRRPRHRCRLYENEPKINILEDVDWILHAHDRG